MLTQFVRDENGATAIEYGLIAALVSVVIIVGLSFLGTALNNTFSGIGETVSDPASAAS